MGASSLSLIRRNHWAVDHFRVTCFVILDQVTAFFEQSIITIEGDVFNAGVRRQLSVDWAAIRSILAAVPALEETPQRKSFLSPTEVELYQSQLVAKSIHIELLLDTPPPYSSVIQ